MAMRKILERKSNREASLWVSSAAALLGDAGAPVLST